MFGLVIFLVALVAWKCRYRIAKPKSVPPEGLKKDQERNSETVTKESSSSQSESVEKIEETKKTKEIASPDDGNSNTPMQQTTDLTSSGKSDKGEVKDTTTPVDDPKSIYYNNINPDCQPEGLKADISTQDSASTGM